jgi:hypothetical protein
MNNLPEMIEGVIKKAVQENLGQSKAGWPYSSIEDYKQKTGKRFRMSQKQMELGLSREQAFEEFMESITQKYS